MEDSHTGVGVAGLRPARGSRFCERCHAHFQGILSRARDQPEFWEYLIQNASSADQVLPMCPLTGVRAMASIAAARIW